MNERDIFLAAIDISNPEERAAYLSQVCDTNTELRSQIEELLQAHQQTDQFLETPAGAVDQTGMSDSTADAAAFQYRGTATLIEGFDDMSEEIPLSFLEPSSKEGSLGRLGHYEIQKVLGNGAFGTVLKAFDEKLHRVVAIKVLSPELAATSPARKRFLREARSFAQVRHQHVVAIYAVEDGPIPYLVMEYIPGQTLQQRLDEHGPLEVRDVLRLGKQIADGLAAAHAQDLIHRDIKPSNILLETSINEHVKITDFGLARAADDASMTQSGVIAGTPMYMAPEQALGQRLDQRADLFSFGSVLYQMLSGRPPFRAPNSIAVLKRITDDTPRPIQEVIPEVPDWMCEIIDHLHAKDPDQRYGSAKEVSDLLAKCLADLEAGGKPTIPAPVKGSAESNTSTRIPETRHLRQRPLATVTAAVLVLFLGLTITEATDVTDFSSTVVRLVTGSGTLVIETDDSDIEITVSGDGETVTVRGGGVESLTLPLGEYNISALKDGETVRQELVTITRNERTVVRMSLEPAPEAAGSVHTVSNDDWPGWPTDAPPPAIAPFDAQQAAQHQQAWADYLGVPVEYENSLGMRFRLIPPGEFTMGSTPSEIAAASVDVGKNEGWLAWIKSAAPQHKVILTQPMYFGITEVTQAEYEQLMGQNPSSYAPVGIEKDAVAGIETANHPVETVSWNDAAEFCNRLSKQETLEPFFFLAGESITPLDLTGYRLPSEAEWEFACRAGTASTYWNGDHEEDLGQTGWFLGNSGGRTHAAGELKANPFGLFDIHGNVFEWVQDGWEPLSYVEFAEKTAIDPHVPFDASAGRVFRGGSSGAVASDCRSSGRYAYGAVTCDGGIGFRVVLPVDAVLNAME